MKKHAIARLGSSLVLGLGLALAVLGLAASHLTVASAAGPWFVGPGGSDANDCLSSVSACQTIGGAVGKATSGDVINIAAGTYTENVGISGKVLTFLGAGAASTIVDGGGSDRVFDTDQAVTLSDLTLQNGSAAGGDGGGLHATAAITLTNVAVLSSTALFNGGGVYATGPALLTGGVLRGNVGLNGGGAYISNTLSLSGTQFYSNTAPSGWGGGARALLAAQVTNATFQGNSASSGGGLYADAALNLAGTHFFSNTAANFGGGAYFNTTATLVTADFAGNTANSGGGAQFNGLANVTGGSFFSNTANNHGGGAYFITGAALTSTLFTQNLDNNNLSGGGGGATFAGAATLEGGAFVSNTARFAGGGAYFGLPAVINATHFTSNTALQRGGGAYFNDTAALTGAAFQQNATPNDRGAGAYFHATAALTSTAFFGNIAASRGGGAYFFAAATLTQSVFFVNTAGVHGGGAYFGDAFDLFNVAFISNTAQTGNGGGLFQSGPGTGRVVNAVFGRDLAGGLGAEMFLGNLLTTTVLHATLANANASPNPGAAIFVAAGSVGVTDTIFANYAGGLIISPGVTLSGDYNLFFNAPTNAISGSHSLTGTDPLLVDPANLDFSLGPGSPAAGAGVDVGVATDLEGTPRANPPSIGAYELPTDMLTVATAGSGAGTVTIVPSATVYAQGTVVTLTATPDPGASFAGWSGDAGGLTNPITLTIDSNKSVTATFNLIPPPVADLTIGLHGAPSLAPPGALVTYTLVVTNTGPDPASGVRLTDTLALSSTFQSLSAPGGWGCATPSAGATGPIVCTAASLSVGAPAVFTVAVRLLDPIRLPAAALVSNTAIVTSAVTDPSGPNTASATTTVFAYRYDLPLMRR